MFVARPGVLLDLLAQGDPGFAERLRTIAAEPERMDELWPLLPRIAVDHAVAEPAAAAGRVAVVPVDPGWDDIGDFDALAGAARRRRGPGERAGRRVAGALGRRRPASSCPGSGRVVAVVGLDDVVVVDTPDALLVTSREHAQRVKEVVAGLGETGHADLA